jgi:hypothetical protein
MDADGVLYGLNPASGAVQEHAMVGPPANHFPTPSVGDGLLLAAAATRVVAYTATSTAGPTSTSTTGVAPTGRGSSTTRPAPVSAGSSDAWIIAVAVAGGLLVLGTVIWLVRRRRSPRDVP